MLACSLIALFALAPDLRPAFADSQATISAFTTAYPVPDAPLNVVAEAPGRIWYTLPTTSAVGSLVVTSTVDFQTKQFTTPTANSEPYDIAYANGVVWFTERAGNKIGRLQISSGVIQEFAIPTANSAPTGITVAANGDVWFVEQTGHKFGRFTPGANTFSEFAYTTPSEPNPDAQFEEIVATDSGLLWATAPNLDRLVAYRVSDNRFFTFFPGAGSKPQALTLGAAGNIWFTTYQRNQLNLLAINTLSLGPVYALPTSNDGLVGLAYYTDGNTQEFWFTGNTSGNAGVLKVKADTTTIGVDEILLQNSTSQLAGITVDSAHRVWVAAKGDKTIIEWRPAHFQRVYLPAISK